MYDRALEDCCTKGRCQLVIGEHWQEVLGVNSGIVATSLSWVDVPTACERVRLGTEITWAEADNKVEL